VRGIDQIIRREEQRHGTPEEVIRPRKSFTENPAQARRDRRQQGKKRRPVN